MAHIITVGRKIRHFDRMRVTCNIRAHKLPSKRQAFYRPAAPVKANQIRNWILLRLGFLQTRQLELVQKERAVKPQMVGWTYRYGRKSLAVLVLGVDPFGQQVVQRLEERYRNKISCLDISFRINNRVSDRELDILDWLRICSHSCQSSISSSLSETRLFMRNEMSRQLILFR